MKTKRMPRRLLFAMCAPLFLGYALPQSQANAEESEQNVKQSPVVKLTKKAHSELLVVAPRCTRRIHDECMKTCMRQAEACSLSIGKLCQNEAVEGLAICSKSQLTCLSTLDYCRKARCAATHFRKC